MAMEAQEKEETARVVREAPKEAGQTSREEELAVLARLRSIQQNLPSNLQAAGHKSLP
jgi:hypothetical protein